MVDASDILALCRRRGFIWPSFEIYGGVAGMFDYGPLGCVLRNNIVEKWRALYKGREGFVEIDSETVSPREVFRASGHVDAFSDFMTFCKKCESPFRADHLVSGFCENPDVLSAEELEGMFAEHGIKCPECGGDLGKVEEFNLMFRTNIGPGSKREGFLRPETAQGIFVNYPNLYRYNREKLPLGVIQTGRGYRNEIAPRQGMIRMREFNMMEVELFVDPDDKSWSRFDEVKDCEFTLMPQEGGQITVTVGEAVSRNIIVNEVLAYFVYATKQLLMSIGVKEDKIRFRQHLKDEMAHYAADCWDAEVELSYGWTEVTGVADRGCWDLSRHAEFSGQDMTHFKRFDEPREVEEERIRARHKALGPRFKNRAKKIAAAIEGMSPSDIRNGSITVTVDGEKITLTDEFFEVALVREKVSGVRVIPHVIEPSYGLDRLFYSVLEHAYDHNEEEDYTVLHLKPSMAPVKVGVFPLMEKDGLDDIAFRISEELRMSGIETVYDGAGTIGKRYARMDEIGTPWCITVDYETVEEGADKGTVTLRYRDTKEQVRLRIEDAECRIKDMLCEDA
ncbi:MAG: glycine--tRNA ligase [Thermoplasmatales archaeon]|nr:glycine--tRNA ligase [Thermoplasmatales archaeon]